MINLEKKAEELAEKYGEPWKGAEGRYLHERKALHGCCPPVLGVVTDNRDPEGLGTAGNRNPGPGGVHSERQEPGICSWIYI